jgi:hypothetical protein
MVDGDFVVHCAIHVDAPRDVVWPFIVDTNGWFGQQKTHSVGGPAGQVGERFHAMAVGSDVVMFCLENVELQFGRRRTLRINAPDGTFYGYSSWLLADSEAGTEVTYDVYCRYPMPAGTDRVALTNELSRTALANLKIVVETR